MKAAATQIARTMITAIANENLVAAICRDISLADILALSHGDTGNRGFSRNSDAVNRKI